MALLAKLDMRCLKMKLRHFDKRQFRVKMVMEVSEHRLALIIL